jgi:glutamate 5-kinase
MPTPPARPSVSSAQRVVVKLGTRVLTHDDGRLALSRLVGIVEEIAKACKEGRQVLIVSSGAVGLGCDALSISVPRELPLRQACAAIGQARLMRLYQDGFQHFGLLCAQVLLSEGDFHHRERYLNLREALTALLRKGVVPIINENDVVSTAELALGEGGRSIFGDNDRLSALVGSKLGADLLVLLTDVEGVYDKDPSKHPTARLLHRLEQDRQVEAGGSGSGAGRGGMESKLAAAKVASKGGCQVVIASGRHPGALGRVLTGEEAGTWLPAGRGLSAHQRWIAFATAPKGSFCIDGGAVEALQLRGASLLAAGVSKVSGDFQTGDIVEIRGPRGEAIGRGMVSCDGQAAREWARGVAPDGVRSHDALVHRDRLVLEGER